MGKLTKIILRCTLVLVWIAICVLLLKIPAAISYEKLGFSANQILVCFWIFISVVAFLAYQFGGKLKRQRLLPLFIIILFPFFIFLTQIELRPAIFAIFILLYCVLLGVYLRREKEIPASGIISLLFFLSALLLFEETLGSIGSDKLRKEISSPKHLVLPDRGIETYRKNGFRGKRPCSSDCPEDLYRIVTIGGSSVFGVPMVDGRGTYSAFLEKMLNERRNDHTYEVLNAGIAGYGIMQIIDSLQKVIIPLKPKMLIVSTWFNDATAQPGWYGIAGKSDKEAYEFLSLLARIESLPGFKKLFYSRTISLFRYYLGALASALRDTDSPVKSKRKRRMNYEEFRWGLEKVVSLCKENGIELVFVLEALNHTDDLKNSLKRQRYYREIVEVAMQSEIELVDTLTPFSKRKEEWLFYDFIHPNPEGHLLIAETIFSQLKFAAETQRRHIHLNTFSEGPL